MGDKEILRFDCFGEDKGHYHLHLYEQLYQPERPDDRTQGRLYFREKMIEEQIERAAFETKVNSARYLAQSRDANIRSLVIDPRRLEEAAAKMRTQMLGYIPKAMAVALNLPVVSFFR